ncbi:multiple organellar RNA editing factor 7, mitochondrial [Tanacetum coccineum]
MIRTFIRLPVTATSNYFPQIRHRFSSTAGPDPKKLETATSAIDGCDYKHWLVVMDPPLGYPTRIQIVDRYLQTLASALGSEEEAKRSMYSVSTKYYYAFGCRIDENVIPRVKSMPNVRWILPDSHLRLDNNGYGGEPLIDGCVVPYDEMFHEDWLQDQVGNGISRRTRRRRSRRKKKQTDNN